MDMTVNQFSGGEAAGKLIVLYHDEHLLAVNKPAGLHTLPDGYNPDLPHLKSILEPQFGRLWIVHRLDRDTSGAILLARSAEAHRILNTQFETRQVEKVYQALVCGIPDWDDKTVSLPLRINGDRRHRTVVDTQNGKSAITELRRLESLGSFALIEALPHTGRTHQIRAHLAAIALPVLGDALYGGQPALYPSTSAQNAGAEETPLINRCALHARSLDFVHPISGSSIHLYASYPEDLQAALTYLRQSSSQNSS